MLAFFLSAAVYLGMAFINNWAAFSGYTTIVDGTTFLSLILYIAGGLLLKGACEA